MTHNEEYQAQCRALLTVLHDASVPLVWPASAAASDAVVALRPALRALRVAQDDQRGLEAELLTRTSNDYAIVRALGAPWPVIWVSLRALYPLVAGRGRHAVCIKLAVWYSGVFAALLQHGTYNPATNHEPLPGQELDTIERRERIRAGLHALFPDGAALFYGKEEPYAN